MYFEIASKNMNSISVALTVAALLFVTAEGWNTGDGGVKWLPNCDFPGSDLIPSLGQPENSVAEHALTITTTSVMLSLTKTVCVT